MKDREFLMWVHARLQEKGDDPLLDFMHKIRAIIWATPAEQETPNVLLANNLEELKACINQEGG